MDWTLPAALSFSTIMRCRIQTATTEEEAVLAAQMLELPRHKLCVALEEDVLARLKDLASPLLATIPPQQPHCLWSCLLNKELYRAELIARAKATVIPPCDKPVEGVDQCGYKLALPAHQWVFEPTAPQTFKLVELPATAKALTPLGLLNLSCAKEDPLCACTSYCWAPLGRAQGTDGVKL
ncbi:ORF80 [Ranid herpesvirus 1]|uniref:ORF80 n=1 Tax=Ranid herpesvirus 1 TaxID=85655 RepID=Q9YQY8_9VIRU|nr:ORF80 [Ranid herpesvirus 1]AAD12277.1 ORF80 [Ranid herpesvirus 1]